MKVHFHGFAVVGGTLDNGNPWKGIRIMTTPVIDTGALPRGVNVGKTKYTDELLDLVAGIEPGQVVDISCDFNGRITGIIA